METCLNARLTKHQTDYSSRDFFSYGFFCDSCMKEWKSQKFLFLRGGSAVFEHEETRNLVWMREHQKAFDRANLEAHFHFNNCPVCGRWVCDDCFDIEGQRDYGTCTECKADKGASAL